MKVNLEKVKKTKIKNPIRYTVVLIFNRNVCLFAVPSSCIRANIVCRDVSLVNFTSKLKLYKCMINYVIFFTDV